MIIYTVVNGTIYVKHLFLKRLRKDMVHLAENMGQNVSADVVEIKSPGNKSADLLGISFYDLAFGIAVRLARKGIVVDEILSGVPQIHTKRFIARRVELFFGSDAVLIND